MSVLKFRETTGTNQNSSHKHIIKIRLNSKNVFFLFSVLCPNQLLAKVYRSVKRDLLLPDTEAAESCVGTTSRGELSDRTRAA